ncbi:MAG: ester cyclase [Dehalococcoidia bacterium]
MSVEANVAATRRLFEDVWSQGNLDAVDEIFAADYLDHVVQGPEPRVVQGPEAFKQVVATFRTAFPDLHYTIDDLIATGDKVVTRFAARGTHRGAFMGLAPTGKSIAYTGIDIGRFENGRLAEAWASYDALGLLQQLGLANPPTP